MSKYYLAIDIGASSGRHMLCRMDDGKLVMEEIYRFENGMDNRNGRLYWDTERLFKEIVAGLKKAGEMGKTLESVAVDTWAVDYVLTDEKGKVLAPSYGYRDIRINGMDEEVYRLFPERGLYEHTGIQHQSFNTIFQLMASKINEPDALANAKAMLMLPDYFNYRLTGVMKQEYTNATSTGLVNAASCDWDEDIIKALGYPWDIFLPIEMPGTLVGTFTDEIKSELGFDCKVVMAASHDTASAVMAVPAISGDVLYISSGTWSLMGVENMEPITTGAAQIANFTNEGGYERRYRFLKNIMGLWMIQQVRHELNDKYSFAELCDMAENEKEFPARVDVNDECFLAPLNMQDAVRDYLSERGRSVPENTGQMAAVIYESLSDSYVQAVIEIEGLTGKHYDAIHIVGGGSNAAYLNRLTAQKTGRRVLAGPGEATAIGNIMAQMIADGVFSNLREARACVAESFEITEFA